MIQALRSRRRAAPAGGFTIVELLIACVVCSILVTIAVGLFFGFRTRATDTTAKANVAAIVPPIESYHAEHGTYAGMTPQGLAAAYDQALDTRRYSIPTATADTYCVESTIGGETWRKNGPDEGYEKAACA